MLSEIRPIAVDVTGDAAASWLYASLKRSLDVVGAVVLILMLVPAFAIVGLMVLFDSGRPIFYRGVRVGQGGQRFSVVKFRTMRSGGGDDLHAEYIRELMRGAKASHTVFKVPADPRVTRVGAVLRKCSLDELPQLWNVLRGEMSLVGPRPDVTYSVECYEDWMFRRLAVRPGITGLWQVSGRSNLGLRDMLRLDVEYVEQRSLRFDLWILVRTLPVVVSRVGAA